MLACEEAGLVVVAERAPIAANLSVQGYYGFECAHVVVSLVAKVTRQYHIPAFICNQIFVVRGYQQIVSFVEASGPHVVGKVKGAAGSVASGAGGAAKNFAGKWGGKLADATGLSAVGIT